MVKDELISMLVGAGAGYLIGSAKKVSAEPPQVLECLSTPLNNPAIIPTLSLSDYLTTVTFDPDNTDWWLFSIVQDTAVPPNIVAVLNAYFVDVAESGQSYLQRIWVYNLTTKQFIEKQDIAVLNINGDIITLTSGSGITTYDTIRTVYRTQIPSLGIDLVHQGNPVKFQDGNIAVVNTSIPTRYVFGFDAPGKVMGTIAGSNAAGFGNLERAHWNFDLMEGPRYAWIPFSGSIISGLFVTIKFWKDAGIWYNGQYLKPQYFEVENTGISSRLSKKVIAYFEGIGFLELNMQILDSIPNHELETIYKISIVLNGTLIDQGYAWQESSAF